jgi:hypothetical protein
VQKSEISAPVQCATSSAGLFWSTQLRHGKPSCFTALHSFSRVWVHVSPLLVGQKSPLQWAVQCSFDAPHQSFSFEHPAHPCS